MGFESRPSILAHLNTLDLGNLHDDLCVALGEGNLDPDFLRKLRDAMGEGAIIEPHKLRAAEGVNDDVQNGFMFEFSEASRHRHGRFRPDEYSQSEQTRSKNSAHLWRNLERAVFAAGQLSLQSKQAPRDRSRQPGTGINSQPEQIHRGKRAHLWRNLERAVFAAGQLSSASKQVYGERPGQLGTNALCKPARDHCRKNPLWRNLENAAFAAGKLSLESKCSTRVAKQCDAKQQGQACDAQRGSYDCRRVRSEMELQREAQVTACVPSVNISSNTEESQAQVGERELGRGHAARGAPNGNVLSFAGVSVTNSSHGSSLSVDDRVRFGLEDNYIGHCQTNKALALDEGVRGSLPCGSVQPISMARTLAQLEGAGFGSNLSPLRESERQLWRLKVQ